MSGDFSIHVNDTADANTSLDLFFIVLTYNLFGTPHDLLTLWSYFYFVPQLNSDTLTQLIFIILAGVYEICTAMRRVELAFCAS